MVTPFFIVGALEDIRWVESEMKKKYELTVDVLGPDQGQTKEVRVLNRIPRWTKIGVEYEVDLRHAELIFKQMDIENASKRGIDRDLLSCRHMLVLL